MDYTSDIQRLYVAYFNRPADPVSLQAYKDILSGMTGGAAATQADLEALAAKYFSPSAEYQVKYAGMNSASIVNELYNNLFNRDAETAGLVSWAAKLDAGTETVASIALQLTYSAQGTDADTVTVKVAAATAFTAAVDTVAEITTYSGTTAANSAATWLAGYDYTDAAGGAVADYAPAAADVTAGVSTVITAATPVVTGSSFTLTTSADAVNGSDGNDSITGTMGTSPTLSPADEINGGAGTDTLTVSSTGTTNTNAAVTMTGVENIVIADSAGTKTTIDALQFSGREDLGPGVYGNGNAD